MRNESLLQNLTQPDYISDYLPNQLKKRRNGGVWGDNWFYSQF